MAITITIQPTAEQAVRLGATAQISVTASDADGATYRWYKQDKGVLATHQTTELEIAGVKQEDFGIYWVEIEKDGNVIRSAKSILAFDDSPVKMKFTQQPTDVNVDADGSFTGNVTATTDDPLNPIEYEWVANHRTYEVTQTGTLTVAHATADMTGPWFCIARSGNNIVVSDTFNVTVSNKPFIRIITQPTNFSAAGNTEAVFESAIVTNYSDRVVYQWYRDDAVIDSVTNPSAKTAYLFLNKVVQDDNGKAYKCKAMIMAFDHYGLTEAETDAATLTVTTDFAITENTALASKNDIRPGAAVSFDAGVSVNDPRYKIHYQWKKDGQDIVGATKNIYRFIADKNSAGAYSFTAHAGPEGAIISHNAAPANLTVDTTQVTLDFVSQPSTLKDMSSGVPFFIAGEAETNDPNDAMYRWKKDGEFITELSDSGVLSFRSPAPSDAGTYVCVAYAGEDTWAKTVDSDASVVTVTDGKEIAITVTTDLTDRTVSLNSKVALVPLFDAGGVPLMYEWYFNGELIKGQTTTALDFYATEETKGKYQCVAYYGGVRKATNEITISLAPYDKFESFKQPKSVVWRFKDQGPNTFVLDATAVSKDTGQAPSYKWFKDGTEIQNQTNATYTVVDMVVNKTNYYRCEITLDNQVVNTKDIYVVSTLADMKQHVNPLPSRNSAFIRKGYWVTDQIELAAKYNHNWVHHFEVMKYPDEIETIVAAMAKYGQVEVQESRNGYVLKLDNVPDSWGY